MIVEVKIVSMASSIERRRFIESNIAFKEGFGWSFFDALTHDSHVPNLEVNRERQLKEYGRVLTSGEVGCFKSHFAVLSHFLSHGTSEWLLVLEDDVWIDPDFSLLEVVDFSKSRGINYIRLFAKVYKPATIVTVLSGFRQVIRFKSDPYGTQAYLINKKGCAALLAGVKQIAVPIDDEMGRFWRHGLDAYSVFPFPVVERSVTSTLTAAREASSGSRAPFNAARMADRVFSKSMKTLHNLKYSVLGCLKNG
jgi:glycosyl transferase family 25